MTAAVLSAAESWKLWDSAGRYRGPSGAELLKKFRDVGPVRLTAYERIHLWQRGPLDWHLIVLTERMEAEVAGGSYESRTEAELALPTVARKHGCKRSGSAR